MDDNESRLCAGAKEGSKKGGHYLDYVFPQVYAVGRNGAELDLLDGVYS